MELEDISILKSYLDELAKLSSSKTLKDAIETMLKIHRNILQDEDNIQYRKIKIQNPAFYNKIWKLEPARGFMLKCGWLEVSTNDGEVLVFNYDENLVDICQVLVEQRMVIPEVNEWQDETKIENLHVSQQKEEELRRKAALERQKQIAAFQKDKLYREELAKNVKAQIEDDKKKRSQLQFTQPAIASPLGRKSPARRTKPTQTTSATVRRLGD